MQVDVHVGEGDAYLLERSSRGGAEARTLRGRESGTRHNHGRVERKASAAQRSRKSHCATQGVSAVGESFL